MKMIRKYNLFLTSMMMGTMTMGIGIGTLDGENEITDGFYAFMILGGVMFLFGIIFESASGLKKVLRNTLKSYDEEGSINS